MASTNEIFARCASFIAEQIHVPVSGIGADVEFDDFGLDSALVTTMLIDLEEWLGVELSPSLVFEEPTLNRLSRAVARQLGGA
ncbi:acyl carrier protein [Variovorax paradoxus]|nr:acyl carrier protein [Variovorax paradoxus]